MSSASTEGVSGRTAAGATLMIVSRLGTRSIDFATLVILGRLLSPADFGLVAIAMSVMMIIEAVSELPTLQALMRVPVLSKTHYDTGFSFAILRALGLAVALELASCLGYVGTVRLVLLLGPAKMVRRLAWAVMVGARTDWYECAHDSLHDYLRSRYLPPRLRHRSQHTRR